MITIKPHNQLIPQSRLKMALEAIADCETVTIDLSDIEPDDDFLNAFIIDLIDNDAKRYNKYVTLTGIEQSRIDDLLLARRKYHIAKSRDLSVKFKSNYHNVRDKLGRFKALPNQSDANNDDAFLDGFDAARRLKSTINSNEALTAWRKYK